MSNWYPQLLNRDTLSGMSATPLPQLPIPKPVVNPNPSLDMGVTSSALDPNSPNHGSDFAYVIPNTVKLTKEIYQASKPPAVQTAIKMPPGPDRFSACLALAQQGYIIDVFSDAIGNDPVVTMIERRNYGILFTAPMLTASTQPTPSDPVTRPTGDPSRWIKTSLDPADYPPYPVPVVPINTNAVGNFEGVLQDGTRLFGSTGPVAFHKVASGDIQNGKPYTENGITYTAHVGFGLMGESISFSIP